MSRSVYMIKIDDGQTFKALKCDQNTSTVSFFTTNVQENMLTSRNLQP